MRGLTAIRIRLSGDRDRACLEEPGLVLLWPGRCIRVEYREYDFVFQRERFLELSRLPFPERDQIYVTLWAVL